MLPGIPSDPSRRKIFQDSLANDKQSAWQTAHYERGQRDEFTSKLRFGLFALNGGSLLTLLNASGLLSEVNPEILSAAAGFFLLGTGLAGQALIAHQNELIKTSAAAAGRASALDRAVTLSSFPVLSEEYGRCREAMEQAFQFEKAAISTSLAAVRLQALSTGAWISGSVALAAAQAGKLFGWF